MGFTSRRNYVAIRLSVSRFLPIRFPRPNPNWTDFLCCVAGRLTIPPMQDGF